MVFIVVISSVLLAVCTSLKPIYLQNAIDAVDVGAGGALTMFLCYVASILGICPIITLKDGLVEVVGKARGKKAAFGAIRKLVEKEPISGDYCVTVGNANVPETCEAFQDFLGDLLKKREVHVSSIGSIVGTHTGPGAVGLAYIKK